MMPLVVKARLLAARHGRTVAGALVLLGLVSAGAAGVLVADPGTTEVTETENEQTVSTAVGSSAVVTGESTAWEEGTTLTDRSVYLRSATPEVELNSTTTVPDGESVEVSQRLTIVYQVERNGQVIWESEDLLLADTTQVEDGGATARTTLDESEIRNRIGEIDEEFSGVGSVSTQLRTDVNYQTAQYEGELSETGSISFTGEAIAIDDYPSTDRTHAETTTTTEQSPREWPLIAGLTLVGLLSLVGARQVARYDPSPETVAAIEKRLKQARYEEWISRGTLPMTVSESAVEMASLENLVNLAIDSNKRVVHDVDQGVYGVIDGETVYYYKTNTRDDGPSNDPTATDGELPLVPVNESPKDSTTTDVDTATDDDRLAALFDEDTETDRDDER